MKNGTLKKITAMMMAGAMMAGMTAMPVFAEGETTAAPQNVTITKKITKDVNHYAPATEFTFSVTPGSATKKSDGTVIYAGVDGGVKFAENAGTITSTPKTDDIGETTVTAGTTDLTIDSSKFTAPGVYRYVVKETTPTDKYEGITYSSEEKIFDVYVNSAKEVYAYMFVDESASNGKDDGVFTNEYNKNGEGGLNDLTISKTVTGNQGNKSKDFSFTVSVNGASGEKYLVTFSDSTETKTITSGSSVPFTLKNGQTAKVWGLSNNDSYTVTEEDYTSDGYTTTIDGNNVKTETGTIKADTEVKVVNDKAATTPTGIVMDIAPYVIMVAAAVVLAFTFLRKRSYTK